MHSIIRAVSSSPTAAVAVSVVAVAVACVVRLSRSRVRGTAMEGLDEEKYTISQMNLDQAPARRRVREAFIPIQQNLDHCLFKMAPSGVKTEERYEINSRGLEIFSKSWLPESGTVKAIVCFCHGYGDTCTFLFEGIAKKIAASGYGVFAMDYPGFGLSEGLHGYIPSFDRLVDDVIEHYSKIKVQPEYEGLPCFLFGESMGGAVALKIHLKQPNVWDGAVLLAPMCKIADNFAISWLEKQILIGIAHMFPKLKFPQKDLGQILFRDVNKRKMAGYNVIAYKDWPRFRTDMEMLRTTSEIEKRLQEVSLPLLILHGAADMITDLSGSKALYEKSKNVDKQLEIYEDAYHAILDGEPDETIFQALGNIISWLDAHGNSKHARQ